MLSLNRIARNVWCRRAAVVGAAIFAATAIGILVDGRRDEAEPTDLGIVFGNKIELDGTPAPGLQARLDRAFDAYRDGIVAALFVSGGFGKEGFDEAVVMRDYLVARGIPATAITVDGKGDTTELTSLHACAHMEEHGLQSATVISEHFHISRCKLLCRRAGIGQVRGLGADDYELGDLYATSREVVAYWAYLLRLK